MSRLTCFVYLTDENGEVHAFGPKSTVPDWARERITNPHIWDSAPSAEVQPSEIVATGGGGGAGGSNDDGPPPQGGAGASRQKWADYATSKGVTVEADWKREDIIAACELAGVPV